MITPNSIDNNINPIITYNNLELNNKLIIKETKDKSGIYRITNNLNGNIYIEF
jgi:hypothetical protein